VLQGPLGRSKPDLPTYCIDREGVTHGGQQTPIWLGAGTQPSQPRGPFTPPQSEFSHAPNAASERHLLHAAGALSRQRRVERATGPFLLSDAQTDSVEKEETFTTVSAKTQPAQDAQAQTVERQRRQSEVSTLSRSLSNLQPPNDKRSPHTQEGGRNTAHRPDAKASAISSL